MKTIIFTLCLLGISLQHVFAQLSDEKRHFLSVNAGLALPIGDYATTSGDKAAYAAPGVNVNFEGAYYVKPFIGFGGMIGYFINKVDQDAFQKDFSYSLNSSGLNASYTGTVGSWSNYYGLIGPYVSLPLKKITLDLKVLGGFVTTYIPTYDITIVSSSLPSSIHAVLKSSSGTAFGFGTGIGGRYHFSQRMALKVNADFITASPDIKETSEVTYQGNTTTSTDHYTQPVSVFNFNVGFVFQLTK